ncbi:MAG: 4Fe-4S binding protein [Phycisphaerae bacterium]|nr:4Fe-4S binding protein [Phycisphaerae bacterium]
MTQAVFLLLTVAGVFVVAGNAERWCPFGGVEALYTYAVEGNMTCSLGVSNFYILGAVLVMTLLLRRAFCGYVCPVGTIFTWTRGIARRSGVRAHEVPATLDRALSVLKYVVLAIILFFTWRTAELVFRGYDPCYALIGRHGDDITFWAYVISGVLLVASVFLTIPFCRWLCPLAAVLNPFSWFGLARVKRIESDCVECGRCARVCPMAIPVDRLREVKNARCMACLKCVESCPTGHDGTIVWGPPDRLGRRWPSGVAVGLILLCTSAAVAAAYLAPLPSFRTHRGAAPSVADHLELRMNGLDCRGRANLLKYFLERDDLYAVDGYVQLEAWPGPGLARVRISFDPQRADAARIRRAITEPYYDAGSGIFRFPPFEIEDYDALATP